MKDEEMVNIEFHIEKEIADIYNKLTKKELLNRLYCLILKVRVQSETIKTLETDFKHEKFLAKQAQDRLHQSENYNEQARTMLEAIMEKWYEYD